MQLSLTIFSFSLFPVRKRETQKKVGPWFEYSIEIKAILNSYPSSVTDAGAFGP